MAAMQVDEHWISHPHGRLYARSWAPAGAAALAPLVLLHDSLGCVALWRDFPALLCAATGRRVVAYDRLGFGRSDARAGAMPLDFIADEARRFFPALPGRCAALITESAQAFVEDRTLQGLRAAQAQFAEPGQLERLARYHGDQARWVLGAWLQTWLSPAFAGWSLAEVLPSVRCPVLALHGADDEYGSPRHPELIARLAGGPARAELLVQTGHVPHRERTDLVIGLTQQWLATNET
jgi:pimeloyl-ACP methyl ester carboxylesterase